MPGGGLEALWNRYNVSDLTNVLVLVKKDRLLSGVLDANDVTNSSDLLKGRPGRGRFGCAVNGRIEAGFEGPYTVAGIAFRGWELDVMTRENNCLLGWCMQGIALCTASL